MINDSTLIGQVVIGLTSVFGDKFTAAIFILLFLIALGLIFRIFIGFVLLAIMPVMIVFMANGWISMAVGTPILLLLGGIVAYSFTRTST